MRILAVTPWDGQGTPTGKACGIANYAEMLRDHLPEGIAFEPFPEALDPAWLLKKLAVASVAPDLLPHLVWLNYHRGLHSRWTATDLRMLRTVYDIKVVITFHDTYGEALPDALTQGLHDVADAFIVHEPCVGLERNNRGLPKVHVIRQGVLGWHAPYLLDRTIHPDRGFGRRPVLGTCGFNFPWKNYNRLCRVTREAGWGLLILSNNATVDDQRRWFDLNPHSEVVTGYLDAGEIIARLADCDATAFPYECANSGTSGAIRLGIAARKPVIAFAGCRQFRDLFEDPDRVGRQVIDWLFTWDDVYAALATCKIQRVDPGIVALAERDSWTRHGLRYAHIFEQVALR